MLESNRILFQEIIAILAAEMDCAESLEATTREVRHLMDHDQFDQMRDRLNARGEVFDMMISLDRQLRVLVEKRVQGTDLDEWQAIRTTAEKLRNLMISIMQMDAANEKQIIKKKDDVHHELQKLFAEKKGIKGYAKMQTDNHLIHAKG
jgi:regulator of replication initiation timing